MNLKMAAFASLICAALFVGFGGLHWGFDVRTVLLLAVLGVTTGVLATPELERKKPRSSWVVGAWQTLAGAIGGACIGLLVAPLPGAAGIGVLLGALFGIFAPAWIRHMQVP